MREVRFGIIGLGPMGREFASAAARFMHLHDLGVKPVITAGADVNPAAAEWFVGHVPTIRTSVTDYRELLERYDVDAVYCTVPHDLHEQFYTDIIRAGKHLLGEKPFGIDKAANANINAVIAEHPDVLVRCSSEFPFFPGALKIIDDIRQQRFGKIIEVEAGLLHSSDLNPDKPINWKRWNVTNGEYGCMGDLGLHVLHIPIRAGWVPQQVSSRLSKIVTQRPDGKGGVAECDT